MVQMHCLGLFSPYYALIFQSVILCKLLLKSNIEWKNCDGVLTKCKCQILNLKQYIVVIDLLSNLTETQTVKTLNQEIYDADWKFEGQKI